MTIIKIIERSGRYWRNWIFQELGTVIIETPAIQRIRNDDREFLKSR